MDAIHYHIQRCAERPALDLMAQAKQAARLHRKAHAHAVRRSADTASLEYQIAYTEYMYLHWAPRNGAIAKDLKLTLRHLRHALDA